MCFLTDIHGQWPVSPLHLMPEILHATAKRRQQSTSSHLELCAHYCNWGKVNEIERERGSKFISLVSTPTHEFSGGVWLRNRTFDQCVVKIVRWNVKMIFSITLQSIRTFACDFSYNAIFPPFLFGLFLRRSIALLRCLIQFIYEVDWKYIVQHWYAVLNPRVLHDEQKTERTRPKPKMFFLFLIIILLYV